MGVFVACLTLPPLGGAVTPLPELTDQIKKYADNMSGAAMFVQHWNRAVDDQKSLFPDIGEKNSMIPLFQGRSNFFHFGPLTETYTKS